MKPTLLGAIALTLLFSLHATAQEENQKKNKELGLTTSNFSFNEINFAAVYKWGLDDRYWKIEGTTLRGNARPPISPIDSGFQNSTSSDFAMGLTLAREKRKAINDRVTLFHGMRLGIGLAHDHALDVSNQGQITQERLNVFVTPSVGYGLGIMFNLGESFYFSGELNPSISYQVRYRLEKFENADPFFPSESKLEQVEHNVRLSASQSSVRIGLFYKFSR